MRRWANAKVGKMTNRRKHKILIVDDNPEVLESLDDLLSDEFDVFTASSGEEALKIAEEHPDIIAVVLDIKMAEMDGIETSRRLVNIIPTIRTIFHTAFPGEYKESEIEELEKPYDYITKGRNLDALVRTLRHAASHYDDERRSEGSFPTNYFGLVGVSSVMRRIFARIEQLADDDQKILLLGETGAGKGMVAQAIHQRSHRKRYDLCIANPNSDDPNMFEANLLGAMKGSYTGLDYDRTGLVEYVGEGTLLLDEIGDYPYKVQTALLELCDSGTYRKSGDPRTRRCQARMLFATNQDLEKKRKDKTFRDDLWHRISGSVITVPPLRDHVEDIVPLAKFFLHKHTVARGKQPKFLHNDAFGIWLEHHWPGNIRELENRIRDLVVCVDTDILFAEHIAENLAFEWRPVRENGDHSLAARMKEYEKKLILQALIESEGDVQAAADSLVVNRTHLYRKFKEHGINPQQFRDSA